MFFNVKYLGQTRYAITARSEPDRSLAAREGWAGGAGMRAACVALPPPDGGAKPAVGRVADGRAHLPALDAMRLTDFMIRGGSSAQCALACNA